MPPYSQKMPTLLMGFHSEADLFDGPLTPLSESSDDELDPGPANDLEEGEIFQPRKESAVSFPVFEVSE